MLKPIPLKATLTNHYPQPDVKPLVRDSDLVAPGSAPVKIPVSPFQKKLLHDLLRDWFGQLLQY